jgi:hypothetical protein
MIITGIEELEIYTFLFALNTEHLKQFVAPSLAM